MTKHESKMCDCHREQPQTRMLEPTNNHQTEPECKQKPQTRMLTAATSNNHKPKCRLVGKGGSGGPKKPCYTLSFQDTLKMATQKSACHLQKSANEKNFPSFWALRRSPRGSGTFRRRKRARRPLLSPLCVAIRSCID